MSRAQLQGILGLFGAILLASCRSSTSDDVIRRAFDAAAGDDTKAFADVVASTATFTLMNANPHPLKPADLRIEPGCRLTEFREIKADIVSASGNCALTTPYGDNVPIFFQAYLRNGKIVRVDRMVFPL